ncbi:YSIRK-type signal peptide-containing protein [Staphylococcus lutrae]|uniref:YSIRK-type signal peptide-containing protein n=1 Tax=Staphylococcus lutrae TaxID=155085 RepID=UPI0026ABAAA1
MDHYDVNRRYTIRKYTIDVVSVLAATTFLVSGHDAKAAEPSGVQEGAMSLT